MKPELTYRGTALAVPYRHALMAALAAGLVLLFAISMNAQNASMPPDVIFINGDIYTGADLGLNGKPATVYPRAQAIAVRDGRVVGVGTTKQIEALKSGKTQVVDLGRRFVMPGFNDAHLHLASGGFEHLNVDLADRKSVV